MSSRPHKAVTEDGDRYVDPGMNHALLNKWAKCKAHMRSYPLNVIIKGAIRANVCPWCVEDRQWLEKAKAELGRAPTAEDVKALVARAEELAGHPLLRYAGTPR